MIDETAFYAYRGSKSYVVTIFADGREIAFLIKADNNGEAVSRISRDVDADDYGTISCEEVNG